MLAVLLAAVLGQPNAPDGALWGPAEARLNRAFANAAPVDRARLEAILNRPEFAHARSRGDALADLLARIRDWFLGLLGTRQTQTFAETTRFVVLALALAAALWVALRQLRARRVPRTAPRGPHPSARPSPLADPAAHLALAERAPNPREAIRQALLGLLAFLEARRWAPSQRARTNHELALELRARGAPENVASAVERAVRWYDAAFYSLEPVAPDQAKAFVRTVRQVALP